jgi:hypothetical protein
MIKTCAVTLLLKWNEMQKYTDIKEPELDDKIKMNFSMYKDQLAKE